MGDNHPVFAQIYIHDPAQQLAERQGNNTNLRPAVMAIIQGVIHKSHPYAELYKQAFEIMRINLPTANNEVAVIIPGDGSEEHSDHHDIILRLRGGGL